MSAEAISKAGIPSQAYQAGAVSDKRRGCEAAAAGEVAEADEKGTGISDTYHLQADESPSLRREKNAALLLAAKSGDSKAKERLICDNLPLVHRIARRFCGRGTDYDDLCQIGAIGMMRAIDGFDLSMGTAFSTYAVPLIIGEIKKHLRDDGPIKVGRGVRRLGAALMREREQYMAEYGTEPRISDLAARCSVSVEEAGEALEACAEINSLSAPVGDDGLTLEGALPDPGDSIADKTDRIALAEALSTLSGRERQIIILRYYGGLSQKQTGERLGLSQVKISREEKKILGKLRIAL